MSNQVLQDRAYKKPLVIILWILIIPIAILAIILCLRAINGDNVNLWGLDISKCTPVAVHDTIYQDKGINQFQVDSILRANKSQNPRSTSPSVRNQTPTVTNKGDVKNQNTGPNYGQVGDNNYGRPLTVKERTDILQRVDILMSTAPEPVTRAVVMPYPGVNPQFINEISLY